MPNLFVVYAHGRGAGNHVFLNTSPPASPAELKKLEAELIILTRAGALVITNWIVMG